MAFSERLSIDNSIHYRIHSILRQRGWFVEKKNVALVKQTGEGIPPLTYAIAAGQMYAGKPFVFMDAENNPWTGGVAVKVAGTLVPRTAYKVDYKNGRITFLSNPGGTVTADLMISLCHVREGYPDDEWLEKNELPVVAWTLLGASGKSFALATSLQDRTRLCEITVFAANEGQAKDLMEDLWRFISYIPLLNMTEHQYLDYAGELDSGFNYADQWVDTPTGKYVLRQMNKPRATLLPPRTGGSSKERNRALVAFEVNRVS